MGRASRRRRVPSLADSDRWLVIIGLAMAAAFALKLQLAMATFGSTDMWYWQTFATTLREYGGLGVYQRIADFNHPPAMLHILAVVNWLSDTTMPPFNFWMRLPAIVADLGTVALLWKLREVKPELGITPGAVVVVAAAPASIMISGFHGNTEFLFLSLTPGFGIQYLAWAIPWIATRGRWGKLFAGTSGLFLFLVYTYWSHGLPWNAARAWSLPGSIVVFEVLCWASVVALLAASVRAIRPEILRSHQ